MTTIPPLVHAARRLRQQMSLPEVLLWQDLRERPAGLKFRRQHAIGEYVLDFYCASAKLAVEIDGRSHDCDRNPENDVRRDAWLAARYIDCLRIAAKAVLEDRANVIAAIVARAANPRLDDFPVATPLHHAKRRGPPPRSGEDFLSEVPQWNI